MVNDDECLFATGSDMLSALGFLFARNPDLVENGFACKPDKTRLGTGWQIVEWNTNPSVCAYGQNRIEAVGRFILIHRELLDIVVTRDLNTNHDGVPEQLADDTPTRREVSPRNRYRHLHVLP